MLFQLRYKVRGESYKNAGEGIVRIADDEKANLIIMGARGLGAVKRAFVGSTSEYVVRHSGVPTLIIPQKYAKRVADEGEYPGES